VGLALKLILMCNYLQDPRHVARFQHLCGVRGTFPEKRTKPDRGSPDSDRPGLRRRNQSSDEGVGSGAGEDAAVQQVNGLQGAEPGKPGALSEGTSKRNNGITKKKYDLYLMPKYFSNEKTHKQDSQIMTCMIKNVFYYIFSLTSCLKTAFCLPDKLLSMFFSAQYPFLLGFSVALSWSVLVCVSRVYMGMHSILEVITGFLYSLLVLAFFCPLLHKIDSYYMMGQYSPLVVLVSHVSLGLVAFSLDSWSTSRGDTAQALGTAAGAALASHMNYQLGLLQDPPLSSLPLTLPALSAGLVLRSLLRFLIGVAVLLLTRMMMKAVTIPFLCRLFGLPADDVRQARQQMRVELPYRYIVYSVVGFSCVFFVPQLFSIFNLA
uniref:Sphingosine-1-phosphate phosphatase 1a n=1 Tax=Oryzias sinensis TaxID=183150 RepID=A0A8C7Z0A5_9TELE